MLKCPIHIWGLDALLKVYPGARIIFTHRDPLTSISSTASMVYRLRALRQYDITPQQVGSEMLYNWGRVLDKAEAVRQRYPASQFFDLHVSEIQRDPMNTIDRIYEYFKLPLAPLNREAINRFATEDPTAGHGGHNYTPADFRFQISDFRFQISDFRLEEKQVRKAVGRYMDRNLAVLDAASGTS